MTNNEETSAALDLVWEVDEIAKLIGRNHRQTNHMLAKGQLPAKKVGGRWVAERSKLIAFFMGEAA
ncbi:DNA-binding protein [Rhizobium ruizarguesonis]